MTWPTAERCTLPNTIEAVRAARPELTIEILVPDFNGKDDAMRTVMAARPHIFNHNLETVERLTPLVRSRAQYHRSLQVLKRAKEIAAEMDYKTATKSGLMLGLGETETELFQAMDDLRAHDVTVLTLGQYLRPSPQHLAGGLLHSPRHLRELQADRPQQRLPPRRLCPARPQQLPRRRLQARARRGLAQSDAGFPACIEPRQNSTHTSLLAHPPPRLTLRHRKASCAAPNARASLIP